MHAAHRLAPLVLRRLLRPAVERLRRAVPVEHQHALLAARPTPRQRPRCTPHTRGATHLSAAIACVSRISHSTSSHRLHTSVGRRSSTSCRPVDTRLAMPIATSLRWRGSDMLSNCTGGPKRQSMKGTQGRRTYAAPPLVEDGVPRRGLGQLEHRRGRGHELHEHALVHQRDARHHVHEVREQVHRELHGRWCVSEVLSAAERSGAPCLPAAT